jgi:hypothetical protein
MQAVYTNNGKRSRAYRLIADNSGLSVDEEA